MLPTDYGTNAPSDVKRAHDTKAVVDAIRRVTRALRLAAGRTQAAAGVSAAQLYVLRSLADGDGASITELANKTYTDRSSVAAVVARLTERGLVVRSLALQDRRRAEVRLSETGKRVLESAPKAPTEMLVSALEQLDPREIGDLAHSLDRLVLALGLESTPVRMLFDEPEDQ
jgi:DNA-binding MarR family transcriptional regulator